MLSKINQWTFIMLLLAAIAIICLNASFKMHQDSITLSIGREPVDSRLQALASDLNKKAKPKHTQLVSR